MVTLLWLALGALLGLLAWLLPDLVLVIPIAVLAVGLLAILIPRPATAVGAKVAIGFGAFWAVVFAPIVFRDPVTASGATYLLFGGGLTVTLVGLVGVLRNRRRQARIAARESEAART